MRGADLPRCGNSPALNDPKRLKLPLSPPRARPAGAKSTDGYPPDFRTIQTLHNHFPNHPATAFQPRTNPREPQPIHNRPSAARRTIPRLANIHDSTILRVESKNDFD